MKKYLQQLSIRALTASLIILVLSLLRSPVSAQESIGHPHKSWDEEVAGRSENSKDAQLTIAAFNSATLSDPTVSKNRITILAELVIPGDRPVYYRDFFDVADEGPEGATDDLKELLNQKYSAFADILYSSIVRAHPHLKIVVMDLGIGGQEALKLFSLASTFAPIPFNSDADRTIDWDAYPECPSNTRPPRPSPPGGPGNPAPPSSKPPEKPDIPPDPAPNPDPRDPPEDPPGEPRCGCDVEPVKCEKEQVIPAKCNKTGASVGYTETFCSLSENSTCEVRERSLTDYPDCRPTEGGPCSANLYVGVAESCHTCWRWKSHDERSLSCTGARVEYPSFAPPDRYCRYIPPTIVPGKEGIIIPENAANGCDQFCQSTCLVKIVQPHTGCSMENEDVIVQDFPCKAPPTPNPSPQPSPSIG